MNPNSDSVPAVLVTGGSAGLGLEIAKTFARQHYRVAIVGRSQARLTAAAEQIRDLCDHDVATFVCDLTDASSVEELAEQVTRQLGHLNVLVNNVGESDRGLVRNLSAERLREVFDQNVVTTLLCSQAMFPLLARSHGAVVNVGSLAGKVGARYLGAYNAAKHALTGLTQQMRLEWRDSNVHVAIVLPGPIRRDDAGQRYQDRVDESLPEKAAQPGGGTRVKGLAPERVAAAVLSCARKKRTDVILPGHLRLLIAIGNAWPALGDWLLLKFSK